MLKKFIFIVSIVILIIFQANAQIKPRGTGMNNQFGGQTNTGQDQDNPTGQKKEEKKNKPKIPSVIKAWSVCNDGAFLKKNELDTALWFFHVYHPFNKVSISSTFTGNNGGAYISNDFFKRSSNSDFYFARSFDAYLLNPSQIQYFNTTTPYSLLDYSQSENRMTHNETRFNVFHTQNINKKSNFEFIYNGSKSTGQYLYQANKFQNIGLVYSYNSDRFISHSNFIANRYQNQENGGIDPGQPINGPKSTDLFTVQMDDANVGIKNNNFFATNEYRVGKTVDSKADTSGYIHDIFIPRVGFIHEIEISGNNRQFTKVNARDFFKNIYSDSISTNDNIKYNRLTNIFQIKFYEAPDRKYTFGKRIYIGNDQLWYNFNATTGYYPDKLSNTFVGGGIFRNEAKLWQFQADGRIYLVGYRAGQTELTGFIDKALKIGRDTTSLKIYGSLKTLIPDYYQNYYYSNHFQWNNHFSNMNEMKAGARIHSQEFKAEVGANYSLIDKYIYNNTSAIPAQASGELLVLAAYLNKDFENDHFLLRTQFLVQKASNENYLHLPLFATFFSLNYRTIVSKVLHFQIGYDVRYNTAFYADAYEPATSRFYIQNTQKIGNYPYIDVHVNMKLKRTRFFFILMNAASGFLGDNYYTAPDYPYYRRTFRLGIAWSFYD